MLRLSGCDSLIVGNECLSVLDQVLRFIEQPMLILLPYTESSESLEKSFPAHSFLDKQDLLGIDHWEPVDPTPTDPPENGGTLPTEY